LGGVGWGESKGKIETKIGFKTSPNRSHLKLWYSVHDWRLTGSATLGENNHVFDHNIIDFAFGFEDLEDFLLEQIFKSNGIRRRAYHEGSTGFHRHRFQLESNIDSVLSMRSDSILPEAGDRT
jgi:hypothetical protein